MAGAVCVRIGVRPNAEGRRYQTSFQLINEGVVKPIEMWKQWEFHWLGNQSHSAW